MKKFYSILFAGFVGIVASNKLCAQSCSSIITTIAGNGTGGYSGDGGAATAAELYYPEGVVVDNSGNVYIVDYGNQCIRKVNASGIISTIAGNGTGGYSGDGGAATAAELSFPFGVATDGSGNVYIADNQNSRIRKVNTSGIISTIAGNGTAGYSGDGGAATAAELYYPDGVAVDGSGNVYIADQVNGVIRKVNTSGIISTIAGNGTLGYSGDGGAATAGELSYPYGVAVDGSGNVYIVDASNNRIRKVNTSGIISTIAGNGTYGFSGDGGAATAAELYYPDGVAVDGSGNVYIADQVNGVIRKVNTSGIIITIAGNGTTGYSGDGGVATTAELNYPSGVAVDGSGNVYIADYGTQRIRKVSNGTTEDTITGTTTLCAGTNTALSDVTTGGTWSSSNTAVATVGSTGVVYGVAAGTATISYATPCSDASVTVTVNPLPAAGTITGTTTTSIGGNTTLSDAETGGVWSSSNTGTATVGSGGLVTGVTLGTAIISYAVTNGCGTAYATDMVTVSCGGGTPGIITTIAGNGTAGYYGDGGAATAGELYQPYGVAVDNSGNVYIVDYGNQCIRKVNASGIISTIAGNGTGGYSGDGGAATAAELSFPFGVATDGSGNVYIVDNQNSRIRKVNTSGIISTIAGNGTASYSGDGSAATAAELYYPDGVAVDGSGNVYIADQVNGVIRKVNTSGIISTIAGNGTLGYSGDGGAATAGELSYPYGVAVDGSGNVYIVDADNNRIRKVNTSGIISTIAGNGTYGFSGDGGAATAAELYFPDGVAVDGSGNVYIADQVNGVIRKVNTSGIIITIAGNGTTGYSGDGGVATTAELNYPSGVAVDGSGNVYIADYGNSVIREVSNGTNTITGTTTLCAGTNTALSDVTAGGTWSSSNTAVATVGSTGVVYGVAAGTATIIYVTPCGDASVTLTVNTLPSAGTITGTTTLSAGSTTTLADATTGGVWSSSNTAIGTVGSGTGIVTGVAAGTAIISYSVTNSCGSAVAMQTLTVTTGTITGALSVCIGSATTLSDASGGGTWSSHSTGVATIGSSSGIVTGVAAGTSLISYVVSGTVTTVVITVHAVPATISGGAVATGFSTTFTDATAGGTWSSSNGAIATVGASSGSVSGVSAGPVWITYTVSSGCYSATSVNVVTGPAAISAPGSFLCSGTSYSFVTTTPGGTWSSSTIAAKIGSASGIVTGELGGTAIISYTLAGFSQTFPITVYITPEPIVPGLVCTGISTQFGDSGPLTGDGIFNATWSSSNPSVAAIGSLTGMVTGVSAGTTVISFTNAGLCSAFLPVTVYNVPAPITAPSHLCIGVPLTFSDDTTDGTWSSSTIAAATVGSASGIVTAELTGTTTISYTIWSGCYSTIGVTVTMSPAAISGGNVCTGSSTTFTDATSGGAWSSSNTSVAGAGTGGAISGTGAGTAIISYVLPTGCYTLKTVSVILSPAPITGTGTVCLGVSYPFTDAMGGGTWSSSSTAASVVSGTGLVTGSLSGSSTISYSLSGCSAAMTVRVSPSPAAITGSSGLCTALNTTFTDATSGGAWSSSNTSIAVAGTSGIISGIAMGTAYISYSLPSGCYASKLASVNATPASVTGLSDICAGSSYGFTDGTSGGTWSGSGGGVSVGSATGIITGELDGNFTISYTLGGCTAVKTVTVTSPPGATSGAASVEVGLTTTLADGTSGGTWASANTSVASVGSVTGIATGVALGTTLMTYTLPTGCFITRSITVTPFTGRESGSPDTATEPNVLTHAEVKLLPNPNSGVFSIIGNLGIQNTIDVMIEGTDLAGNLVYKNKTTAIEGNMNTVIQLDNSLANGMYLLSIHAASMNAVFHFVLAR